jgi:hypothetical protein
VLLKTVSLGGMMWTHDGGSMEKWLSSIFHCCASMRYFDGIEMKHDLLVVL